MNDRIRRYFELALVAAMLWLVGCALRQGRFGLHVTPTSLDASVQWLNWGGKTNSAIEREGAR